MREKYYSVSFFDEREILTVKCDKFLKRAGEIVFLKERLFGLGKPTQISMINYSKNISEVYLSDIAGNKI